jgi:hypothetical protein
MAIVRLTGTVERREDREVTSRKDGKQYTFHEAVIATNEFVRNRVQFARAIAPNYSDGDFVDVILSVENGDQYGPKMTVTGNWPDAEVARAAHVRSA